MKLRTFALWFVVFALALPCFAGPMKAGKWQVTITTEMPGMPMKMPPTIFTTCVTKEQAENPQPPAAKKDSDCKISNYKLDGNTVTWTIECPKQKTTGEGKIVYSSDSYIGETHMKMSDMEMTQKYSGKYLGACDEK
ncbi:MAG TPA: DUF3617 domain-containing protein [Thermoanaerobaculia bacterium]